MNNDISDEQSKETSLAEFENKNEPTDEIKKALEKAHSKIATLEDNKLDMEDKLRLYSAAIKKLRKQVN